MFALCCTNCCQRIFTKSNVTTWHLYGSGITYLLHGNETKRSVIKLSRGVNLHLLNVRRSLPWLTAFIMDVPSRLCLPQAGGTHSSLRSTKRNFRQTKCSCISFIVLFSYFAYSGTILRIVLRRNNNCHVSEFLAAYYGYWTNVLK